MNSEDDSFWESFPQILETLDGAKQYVNAFRTPPAGAQQIESQTGAHLEGLLVGGNTAINGKDASSGRLPKRPLQDELNELGWPHPGCGAGLTGGTSQPEFGDLP